MKNRLESIPVYRCDRHGLTQSTNASRPGWCPHRGCAAPLAGPYEVVHADGVADTVQALAAVMRQKEALHGNVN